MTGLFSKKTPADLFEKLSGDLERLEKNRSDESAAMDFFVTAESLTDWVYPGRANKLNREKLKGNAVLLQVVSHIASGAKHFQVEAKHHKSIKSTRTTGGYFGGGMFASSFFPEGFFSKGDLLIALNGDAREEYGESISALELAVEVHQFWEKKLSS